MTAACDTCDGTGCPCLRWRDWQSLENGCERQGCGECGRNTCRPVPRQERRLSEASGVTGNERAVIDVAAMDQRARELLDGQLMALRADLAANPRATDADRWAMGLLLEAADAVARDVLALVRVDAGLTSADDQEPCHICGKLPSEPGAIYCSATHGALGSVPHHEGTNDVSADERLAAVEEALRACIPWVASHPRGAAQEALAVACELVDYDAYEWTSYPDVLTQRRELLGLPDRRKAVPYHGDPAWPEDGKSTSANPVTHGPYHGDPGDETSGA